MVPPEIPIVTDGVTVGLIVMVIELEVAVKGEAQVDEDVITHDTTCVLVNVVEE